MFLISMLSAGLAQSLELLPEPDLSKLNQAARVGLDQMPGCYQMQAQIERVAWIGVLRDTESYSFSGKLVDGEWRDLEYVVLSDGASGMSLSIEHAENDYPFMPPMLGRLPEGEAGSVESSVLQEILDVISGDVESSFASLGELDGRAAYVLERTIELDAGRDVALRVWVEDSQTQARRWEARMPRGGRAKGKVGRLKRVVVVLTVDAQGLPSSESVRGTLRMGAVAFRLRQNIEYTVLGSCAMDD